MEFQKCGILVSYKCESNHRDPSLALSSPTYNVVAKATSGNISVLQHQACIAEIRTTTGGPRRRTTVTAVAMISAPLNFAAVSSLFGEDRFPSPSDSDSATGDDKAVSDLGRSEPHDALKKRIAAPTLLIESSMTVTLSRVGQRSLFSRDCRQAAMASAWCLFAVVRASAISPCGSGAGKVLWLVARIWESWQAVGVRVTRDMLKVEVRQELRMDCRKLWAGDEGHSSGVRSVGGKTLVIGDFLKTWLCEFAESVVRDVAADSPVFMVSTTGGEAMTGGISMAIVVMVAGSEIPADLGMTGGAGRISMCSATGGKSLTGSISTGSNSIGTGETITGSKISVGAGGGSEAVADATGLTTGGVSAESDVFTATNTGGAWEGPDAISTG